jgi:lipid-binding SYLF domain-containing protein
MLNRRSLLAAMAGVFVVGPVQAASRAVIDNRVQVALGQMYAQMPQTRDLASRAVGMLVMPSVMKGGFILGGAYGEGALLTGGVQTLDGPPAGYYSVAAASVGFQIGVQTTGHALFFMTQDSLDRFQRKDGWEIGADAEVTFPDAGLAWQLNSTLMNKPVIGVVFGQDGLLIGASIEGAKYSRIVR